MVIGCIYMNLIKLSVKSVIPNTSNPRFIKDKNFTSLVKSLKDFPEMSDVRPVVVNMDNVILGGNMRYKAMVEAGWQEIPVTRVDWPEAKQREFIIKDNVSGGDWDWDVLANEWDTDLLNEWGLDTTHVDEWDKESQYGEAHLKLTEKFIVPPFSILDTKQGYWQDRKKTWNTLIGDLGESRQNTLAPEDSLVASINNGVSILDAVLAEVACRWFGMPNSKMFDPFAGDTVFGYVSSYLGNTFTGIELRPEQAEYNNQRTKDLNASYICDDGQNVAKHIAPNSQDLLFSCPPYYDLEVYSDLEADASNQETYQDFFKIIDTAFTNAITCLKDDRFAVIVVGDVRDKGGEYVNFVGDVKRLFIDRGMYLYNELILVNAIGTAPTRANNSMVNRKVVKMHQNVLVFYKGNIKQIKSNYPRLEKYASTDLEQ